MKDYVTTLHRTVERFKKYQKAVFPKMTEEKDNGEWVFGNRFDDMLYVIARDSE